MNADEPITPTPNTAPAVASPSAPSTPVGEPAGTPPISFLPMIHPVSETKASDSSGGKRIETRARVTPSSPE